MPNWVANRISVTGASAELDRFIEQAKAEPPTFRAVDSTDTEEKGEWNTPVSFANFICPPQEALDSGEYWETHGFSKGEKVGHTPNNRYEFNTREWGTKWDACQAEVEKTDEGVSVSFETAWSPPEPVFKAMVEQFPELDFNIWFEEESGWGAELQGKNGELTLVEEWDVPDSHADYVKRDNEDGCVCAWNDDKEDWYSDCPLPPLYVYVTHAYKLETTDPTKAKDEAEKFLMVGVTATPEEDLSSFRIVDEDGQPL